MIFRFIKPLIFVAVLPVLKGIIQYLIAGHVSGVLGLEAVALGLIILMAVLRWRSISVTLSELHITVEQGFIIRKRAVIELSRLSSVSVRENPLDILCRAVSFRINTEAGKIGKPDFEIKLFSRDAKILSERIYGDESRTAICVSPVRIAAMAATTSSAVTGLIIGVPIANQAANLFGIAFAQLLLGELITLPEKISTYFPQVVQGITLVALIGYAIAAAISFFKNLFFRLLVGKGKLEIRSGLIVKRMTVFNKDSVNNVSIDQTPLMRLFRLYSMSACVGGYGDERGEKALIAPCGNRREIKGQFSLFFPHLKASGNIIRPPRGKRLMRRFFFVPACFSAAVMLMSAVGMILFPYFYQLIFFLAVVAAATVCYYSNLCMYNYRIGRLRFGESISACSSKGFSIREFYCEKENIGDIKLIRYLADMRYGTCKVKLTVRSEGADRIRVRNLDYNTVKKEIYSCYSINHE